MAVTTIDSYEAEFPRVLIYSTIFAILSLATVAVITALA